MTNQIAAEQTARWLVSPAIYVSSEKLLAAMAEVECFAAWLDTVEIEPLFTYSSARALSDAAEPVGLILHRRNQP